MKDNKGKTGFAGLESLTSDVDELIGEASKASRQPSRWQTPDDQPARSHNASSQKPTASPTKAPWKPIAAIAVVAILFYGISSNKKPEPSPIPPPAPPTYAPPAPVPNLPPAELKTNPFVTSPEPQIQAPAAIDPPAPPQPSYESRIPPVGTNHALTTDQIEYCLAEKIRIQAGEPLINAYSSWHVDRFNSLVDDFNSRCSSFRYRPGDLERARSSVEASRALLEAEGRRRFLGPS